MCILNGIIIFINIYRYILLANTHARTHIYIYIYGKIERKENR